MSRDVSETIPGLLAAAARRDPGGTWLRTDEGTLSCAAAASQVGLLAQRLRETGIGHGERIVVTARTTPRYLLCWLALATLGAVTVPTDPAATAQELAGLLGQVRPRALISDAALAPVLSDAGLSRPGAAVRLDVESLVPHWQVADPA